MWCKVMLCFNTCIIFDLIWLCGEKLDYQHHTNTMKINTQPETHRRRHLLHYIIPRLFTPYLTIQNELHFIICVTILQSITFYHMCYPIVDYFLMNYIIPGLFTLYLTIYNQLHFIICVIPKLTILQSITFYHMCYPILVYFLMNWI